MNVGVLVYDGDTDVLHIQIRSDLKFLSKLDETDKEVLTALGRDLRAKADELGPLTVLEWLEETCSNAIQLSERVQVIGPPETAIERIFETKVMGETSSPST